MAPKKKAGEVPKPIDDAKALLAQKGQVVGVDAIAELDHPTRNKAFGALRSHLANCFPEKHKEFMALKDELLKREWLTTFMLDPSDGGSCKKGFNDTTVSMETADGWKYAWLLESSLAGPQWLNSAPVA